jgi:hypothetical protein
MFCLTKLSSKMGAVDIIENKLYLTSTISKIYKTIVNVFTSIKEASDHHNIADCTVSTAIQKCRLMVFYLCDV